MIRATPLAALALMLPLWSAQAADAAFKCPATPTPVVMLDHGSRYVAEDASRSDFDEAANSDVTAQLKPIDDFITDLVQTANRALAQDSD